MVCFVNIFKCVSLQTHKISKPALTLPAEQAVFVGLADTHEEHHGPFNGFRHWLCGSLLAFRNVVDVHPHRYALATMYNTS